MTLLFWSSGTLVLNWTRTLKPWARNWASASCRVRPTTGGTVLVSPLEVLTVTCVPSCTELPTGGTVANTMPLCWSLDSWTHLATRPADFNWLVAPSQVAPTTLGTGTCFGPPQTVYDTVEPLATALPASGSVLVTWPLVQPRPVCGVVACGLRPALSIWALASASVRPTTLGTGTVSVLLVSSRPTTTPIPAITASRASATRSQLDALRRPGSPTRAVCR